MTENTKAKINLHEGMIELEGSEDFVQRNLDLFKEKFINFPRKELEQKQNRDKKFLMKREPEKEKKKNLKPKGINIPPIPLDFKKESPSLKDFFKEKNPESNQEIVTLFTYYLNKKINIKNVLPGHIVSCYNEVNIKKPLNIPALFRDITKIKGWVQPSKAPGSVEITISGENLVGHDLPMKKDEK